MTEPVLILEKNDGIAVLTLNRPQAMNALNREMGEALRDAFSDLNRDLDIKAAILTGAGKAFCGGLDLRELAAMESLSSSAMGKALGEGFAQMKQFDRPIIGAINGPAVTGGFELALDCDILVSSSQAFFADTHARVGFIPGGGLSQKLPRIIGPARAKELSFTGNYLQAEQAEAWGLVNRVVSHEELLDVCLSMARDMLPADPFVIKEYKRLIDLGYHTSLEEGLAAERSAHLAYVKQSTKNFDDQNRQKIQTRGRSQLES
jgi:enoyl-CoA hydratase/carnithine racemase